MIVLIFRDATHFVLIHPCAPLAFSSAFYGLGQQEIVNWRLLFDTTSQGVTLSRGDVVEGPGFQVGHSRRDGCRTRPKNQRSSAARTQQTLLEQTGAGSKGLRRRERGGGLMSVRARWVTGSIVWRLAGRLRGHDDQAS